MVVNDSKMPLRRKVSQWAAVSAVALMFVSPLSSAEFRPMRGWMSLHLGHDCVPSDIPGDTRNEAGQEIEIDLDQVQARDARNLQVRMAGGTVYEIWWQDWPGLVLRTGGVAH